MSKETTTLTVKIPVGQKQALQMRAHKLGMTTEELIRLSIETLVAQPEPDVVNVMEYVLQKNAELYRRLAQYDTLS